MRVQLLEFLVVMEGGRRDMQPERMQTLILFPFGDAEVHLLIIKETIFGAVKSLLPMVSAGS